MAQDPPDPNRNVLGHLCGNARSACLRTFCPLEISQNFRQVHLLLTALIIFVFPSFLLRSPPGTFPDPPQLQRFSLQLTSIPPVIPEPSDSRLRTSEFLPRPTSSSIRLQPRSPPGLLFLFFSRSRFQHFSLSFLRVYLCLFLFLFIKSPSGFTPLSFAWVCSWVRLGLSGIT